MGGKFVPSGLLLVVCLFPFACSAPDSSSPVTKQPQPADGASISRTRGEAETMSVTAEAAPSLTLSAKIAYGEDRFSKISSPLQGRVLEVRVKLGDQVKAGQVLLVVDSPDIAGAYSDYVKEIAELSLAKRNYELALELLNAKAIPMKEYKQAENDLRREQAEFQQAKARLLSLRVPRDELDKPLVQQTIGSRFELKSPLTGTVVERNVTPGQLVGNDAGQVLFTIADLERLQVVANLYERDISLVHVGQAGRMKVEAYPGIEFPVSIAVVGDVVDPVTRTVKVRAWVTNDKHLLKYEMFARLTIPVDQMASIFIIPTAAVRQINQQVFVYVQKAAGRYEAREVTIEPVNSDHVRVLRGLAAGERIATKAAGIQPTGSST